MQYEKEIVELRGAMESLQSRLSRAEQLYLQGAMQAALAAKEREIQKQQQQQLQQQQLQQQQQQQQRNGEEEGSDRSSRFTPSPIESLTNSTVINF